MELAFVLAQIGKPKKLNFNADIQRNEMKKIFTLLMILITTASCKENALLDANGNPITDTNGVAPTGGKTYLIKSGCHYSSPGCKIPGNLSLAGRKEKAWQVYFFENTIYQSVTPTNQHDINKLIGFTDCGILTGNHNNSARFGWNWDLNNKLMKIYAYTYVNKERQFSYITSIPTKTVATLSLSLSGSFYTFQVNDVTVKMPRGCDKPSAWGWAQFPYFGGDETASHDMNIWLKEI